LRWLCSNAAGFILPRLLEGFGLPAAETPAREAPHPVTHHEGRNGGGRTSAS
jgi:hypothetical protein